MVWTKTQSLTSALSPNPVSCLASHRHAQIMGFFKKLKIKKKKVLVFVQNNKPLLLTMSKKIQTE